MTTVDRNCFNLTLFPASFFRPSLALEVALFAGGCWLYAQTTVAKDRIGRFGFLGLVAFLGVIRTSNVFGGPPPSVTAVALVGQAQWLLVLWAYWIDAHRSRRPRDDGPQAAGTG